MADNLFYNQQNRILLQHSVVLLHFFVELVNLRIKVLRLHIQECLGVLRTFSRRKVLQDELLEEDGVVFELYYIFINKF